MSFFSKKKKKKKKKKIFLKKKKKKKKIQNLLVNYIVKNILYNVLIIIKKF